LNGPFLQANRNFLDGAPACHPDDGSQVHIAEIPMKNLQEGKAGYILLWLLGVPIPILFLIYLLRGCT
jgi:hypothetical protein